MVRSSLSVAAGAISGAGTCVSTVVGAAPGAIVRPVALGVLAGAIGWVTLSGIDGRIGSIIGSDAAAAEMGAGASDELSGD
jgi:hypothetical protein